MKSLKLILLSLCICLTLNPINANAALYAQTAGNPAGNSNNTETDAADQTVETDENGEPLENTEPVPVILDTDSVSTDEILMYSTAAIVMDADTGKVLYYKNPFNVLYPASLTKIMTTLVALENSTLSETVTVSQNALDHTTWDSTRLGVLAGQEITMEEALYAVMVTSANDISNAVAEHISGSMEAFCTMMNNRADELGCRYTHFVNPNGLHDDAHYSSAYDLAIIAKAALANETFKTMASAKIYTYTSEILRTEEELERLKKENDGEIGPYVLYSHHKMLNGVFPYEYVYGGKTGYTHEARFTLATFAQKDDMNLICIMLDCPGKKDYIYMDTKAALDYCFENYETLSKNAVLTSDSTVDSGIYTMNIESEPLPLPSDLLNAPINSVTPSNYKLAAFASYSQYKKNTAPTQDTLEKSFSQRAVEFIDFSHPDKKTTEEYIAGIAIIAICIVFLMLLIQQLIRIIKRKRRRIRYNKLKRRRLAQEADESTKNT